MTNLKIHMINTFCMALALTASAGTSISDVVVNQRWPWSEKVDVDFVLSGQTNDVEVTATWDAHPEPYRLGTVFAAVPGQCRFTWDPAKSAFAGQTLTGFTVAVTNMAASAHTYLVVDLVNGGYEFLAGVPDGGWTDAHKSSKMVFRRIPAGTYTLGEEYATFTNLGYTVDQANYYAPLSNRRIVTFTSDFYVGIYKYTEAQHACLETGTPRASYVPQNLSYNALRGEKNADAESNVDWPTTGYKVAEDSIVAKLRVKAGADLLVDLCEEEQWEVAARAGTSTFWPTGGTVQEDFETHTKQVNSFVSWYGTGATANTPVGSALHDNGWGLYDVIGLAGEWTLDKAADKARNASFPDGGLPASDTDPTGADGNYDRRILRSANGNQPTTPLYDLLPCRRQLGDPASGNYATRFCIHLKALGGGGAQ